jgi:adenosylmethionine-8-amino-7-oxononanoate aminotransferase
MTAMIYPTTNPAAAEQMMVTRGEGPYIFDQQGKRYLEASGARRWVMGTKKLSTSRSGRCVT